VLLHIWCHDKMGQSTNYSLLKIVINFFYIYMSSPQKVRQELVWPSTPKSLLTLSLDTLDTEQTYTVTHSYIPCSRESSISEWHKHQWRQYKYVRNNNITIITILLQTANLLKSTPTCQPQRRWLPYLCTFKSDERATLSTWLRNCLRKKSVNKLTDSWEV